MRYKEPRKNSKQIQAELQGQGTTVTSNSICHFLYESALHGGTSQRIWENVLFKQNESCLVTLALCSQTKMKLSKSEIKQMNTHLPPSKPL